MRALGLDQEGAAWPEGLISHVAGPVGSNFYVVDVWDSQEAHDRFAAKRMLPAAQKVGEVPRPESMAFEVRKSFQA